MSFLAILGKLEPYVILLSHLPIEDYISSRRAKAHVIDPPLVSIMPVGAFLDDNENPPPNGDTDVSGTSQLSAEGRACIPCGNDHFSTASRVLEESLRFAREGGIAHEEVILRISVAEDELNAFERIDGDSVNVVDLPPIEKGLMNEMLKASRDMRHRLKDIHDVESLERTAAHIQNVKVGFRSRVFKMQFDKLPDETKDDVRERAKELISSLE